MRKTLEEQLTELMKDGRFRYALKRAVAGHSSRSEMAQHCGVYYTKFNALCQLYCDQRDLARIERYGANKSTGTIVKNGKVYNNYDSGESRLFGYSN